MLLALHICPALTLAGACGTAAPTVTTGGPQDDLLYLRPRLRPPPIDEELGILGLGMGRRMAALLLAMAEDEGRRKH